MKILLRNLLFVVRRFKLSTVLNVLGLSVAFTAFMVIMMQVNYDRTYNHSIPGYERIFMPYNVSAHEDDDYIDFVSMSPPIMELIARQSSHVVDYTYYQSEGKGVFTVNESYTKEEIFTHVAPNFPSFFGFEMVAGDINCLNDPDAVLVPESFARRYFNTSDAVGKVLDMGIKLTIGGVYKDLPANVEISNAVYRQLNKKWFGDRWNDWGWNCFIMYLKMDDARAITEVKKNIDKEVEKMNSGNNYVFRKEIKFEPLSETHYLQGVAYAPRPSIQKSSEMMLMSIAVVILLIAIINFMNFANALMPVRIRSINTYKIFGATRFGLCSILVAESVIISLVSFAITLGMVELLSRTSFSGIVESGMSLQENPLIVGVTALAALLTGVIAGVFPAVRMTAYSPAVVLKGNFGLSPKGRFMRSLMIGFQFFASAALIVGACFVQKQRHYMMSSIDYGFAKDELIVCELSDDSELPIDRNVVVNDIKALPFVENASLSWSKIGIDDNTQGWVMSTPDGRTVAPRTLFATTGYLATMGIKVLEGRDVAPTDSNVVIVNKLTHDKYGDLVDIGKIVGFDSQYKVIGICENAKFSSARNEIEPVMFLCNANYQYDVLNVRVKKGTNMFAAIDGIRKAMAKYDPNFPFKVQFYDEIMGETFQKEVKFSEQITLFSCVAIFISIIGVFGLVMFDSEYRKREIAVRKVFGSTTAGIIGMFNLKYLKILVVAFVIAVPVALYAVGRWLENFAYQTEMSWWIYALTFVGMALLTAATVTLQCYRIANSNPVNSLKYE